MTATAPRAAAASAGELPATPERILEAMGALDPVGGADEPAADHADAAATRKGRA